MAIAALCVCTVLVRDSLKAFAMGCCWMPLMASSVSRMPSGPWGKRVTEHAGAEHTPA
jgi:hypothetical protein